MENNSALRRKDTTKGPPLRILSLDGGGVRGYSMFIIIQELMHRVYVETEGKAPRRNEIPKPADYFDLIVGTGTGGLIAIMLGRLRLDLETCKEVYVRMTRKVFETDKTIAGIPYRSTLFKASKLEEAIRECVREHTVYEDEGNDGDEPEGMSSMMSPVSPLTKSVPRRHASNASVASFSNRSPATYQSRPMMGFKYGNGESLLYDNRENRTKTAVTAIYQGTGKGGSPAILRSYDSRKEPSPEFDCKIWQAGRATCATGLAFKPIQVGQSVFIDEGAGQYNPAPLALDEACVNEWPARDVGVFISIGTGKRPGGSEQNSHLWYEGFMGEFAEARRRLISKIEGCEETHQYMVREGLTKRGVNIENYYRFNVEIGVGEFGMNEWNRLADISTGTKRYLSKKEIQNKTWESATKIAKIHRAKQRFEDRTGGGDTYKPSLTGPLQGVPEAYPNAVELPADFPDYPPPPTPQSPQLRPSYESGRHETLEVPGSSPRTSSENQSQSYNSPRTSGTRLPDTSSSLNNNNNNKRLPDPNADRFVVHSPTPSEYKRKNSGGDKIAITSPDDYPRAQEPQWRPMNRVEPPPLPPKTPINDPGTPLGRARMGPVGVVGGGGLPYPDDGPPPVVNMARKPDYRGR